MIFVERFILDHFFMLIEVPRHYWIRAILFVKMLSNFCNANNISLLSLDLTVVDGFVLCFVVVKFVVTTGILSNDVKVIVSQKIG